MDGGVLARLEAFEFVEALHEGLSLLGACEADLERGGSELLGVVLDGLGVGGEGLFADGGVGGEGARGFDELVGRGGGDGRGGEDD